MPSRTQRANFINALYKDFGKPLVSYAISVLPDATERRLRQALGDFADNPPSPETLAAAQREVAARKRREAAEARQRAAAVEAEKARRAEEAAARRRAVSEARRADVAAAVARREAEEAAEAAERASLAVPGAPAIIGRADPAEVVIARRRSELGPGAEQLQPLGIDPVFETTPEAYARTTTIVPQSSVEEAQARIPFLPAGDRGYPARGRVLPIIDRRQEIGGELARMTSGLRGSNVSNFYHTGPLYEGLDRLGVDPRWIRESFAPTYAGTSPRTNTTQNLRNASMIDYLRGKGIPIDERTFERRGNIPGYGMMGSHYGLSGRLLRGTHDPVINPKPSEFMPNIIGDLTGVTGDTHHIRGVLKAFDNLYPGELPTSWLRPHARQRYLETGEFDPALDVDDTLRTATRGGRETQVEYGPMSMPTFEAARINEVPGGTQQAMQWFGFGDETGLASEPKTIADLLNDRIDVTAQALGIPPEEVMKLYAAGKIPLMAKGGPVRGRYSVGGAVPRPSLAVYA